MIAANDYSDDYARCKLAMVHVLDGEDADSYFQFLARAAASGVVAAQLFMGQLLSPFSELSWGSKSGVEAREHLERAVKGEPGPDALEELAKLLWEGCEGVEVDRERAERLHDQACELARLEGRQFPPLGNGKGRGGGGTGLFVSLAAAAVVVAGFFVLRGRRR
jgi:TPR repeat protein